MPRRLRASESIEVEEANVLPVMNIMFLLIPALLLAMEVASMAAVAVTPPRTSSAPSPKTPDEDPTEKSLGLRVFIQAEGFRVSSTDQQIGAEAGRAQDSSAPTIALAKPGAGAEDYDRYDYAALEAMAGDFKAAYPHESVVTVSAENDVPAQVLISTLDALRGIDCKLGSVKADEAIPKQCLFYRPVVEAG